MMKYLCIYSLTTAALIDEFQFGVHSTTCTSGCKNAALETMTTAEYYNPVPSIRRVAP